MTSTVAYPIAFRDEKDGATLLKARWHASPAPRAFLLLERARPCSGRATALQWDAIEHFFGRRVHQLLRAPPTGLRCPAPGLEHEQRRLATATQIHGSGLGP